MKQNAPMTDSPWYWVLVFAAMALVALLVIGPKYGQRQAGIERKYQARERIAEEQAAGNDQAAASRTDGVDAESERRDFASPERTLIPLWPLAMVLALLMVVAAGMLARGRGRPGSLESESGP